MALIHGELTSKIIAGAIEVHRFWGPGLNEDVYERSLCQELKEHGINYQQQLNVPLLYKGIKVGDDLRVDVFVEEKVVLELKAVRELLPIHEAQLLTYMKLLNARVGLLINFNVEILKDGIVRRAL